MNKIYSVLSYSNYEIKFLVYNVFEGRPFILSDTYIDKIDIINVKSDLEKDKISMKIREALNVATEEFGVQASDLFVVFDPKEYYVVSKSYTYEYPNSHTVSYKDIYKCSQEALVSEHVDEGFKAINFMAKDFVVNKAAVVSKVIGTELDVLTVNGDVVVTDSQTFYAMHHFANQSGANIVEFYPGIELFVQDLNLDQGEGFMEITTDKINFIFNNNSVVQKSTLPIGFIKILEDYYNHLSKTYSPEKSEETVRFLMKYFPLGEITDQHKILNEVDYATVVNEFRGLLVDYIKYVCSGILKQGINVSKIFIHLDEHPQNEFINIINDEISEIEFMPLKVVANRNIDKQNIKSYMMINKMATNELVNLKRGING